MLSPRACLQKGCADVQVPKSHLLSQAGVLSKWHGGQGLGTERGSQGTPGGSQESARDGCPAGWAGPCSDVHQPLEVGVCVPASAAPASTQYVWFQECDCQ